MCPFYEKSFPVTLPAPDILDRSRLHAHTLAAKDTRNARILGLYHGRNSLPARKEESAQTLNHWVTARSTYRDLPYKVGEGGSTHKPSMWTLEVWPGELLGSP